MEYTLVDLCTLCVCVFDGAGREPQPPRVRPAAADVRALWISK